MMTRYKFSRLLLVAVILTAASSSWWIGPTPTAHADEPPIPLPEDCGGSTGPACCIYGYVYYDDVPVLGASVHIESRYGALDTTTASGPASSYPYYSADLSYIPLAVSPGDVITITASYGDMVSARTWMVHNDGQHVDLGLIAGYQAPGPVPAPTKAITPPEVGLGDLPPHNDQSVLAPAKAVAANAGTQSVEMLGHIGGRSEAVFVQGDYAYIGEGPRLTILNISNPSSPTVVGKTDPLPDIVQDIYVTGDYAYVADGPGGLRVVNVSDPANPVEVGFYVTPADAMGVYVVGSTAYVASGGRGLRVVDVSDPADPTELGFYVVPGVASGVYVSGTIAYVAAWSYGLRVVDVSDSENPDEIGFYNTDWLASGVYVVGNVAYVADSPFWEYVGGGLLMLDVSDPNSPEKIGFYDTPGRTRNVYVSGNFAYVAEGWWDGLQIVDVSNPVTPTLAGSYGSHVFDVYVNGNTAYITNNGGLQVVDVSDPANPAEIGSYNTMGRSPGVYGRGDIAYVAAWIDGLWITDVSDPADPTEIASYYDPSSGPGDVYVSNDTAYLVDGIGLKVVDVSNPAWPVEVDSLDTPGEAMEVYVSDNIAYVADGEKGLRLVDVINPALIEEISHCDTPAGAAGVYVVGSVAYVAAGSSGLRVMDVSNPISPECEVGFYDTPGSAEGVHVVGNTAYVADGEGGLQVIDVTNPVSPTLVGSCDTPGGRVHVVGNTAYVASGSDWDDIIYRWVGGGLWVVDASDPANPVKVGFHDTPGGAWDVYASSDIVYVAAWDGGFSSLYYTGGKATPPAQVTVSGPTTGSANAPYTFTADVTPVTVTTPITYVWQATGQSPVTHTNDRSDAAMFTWNITGTQTITVTATNISGTVNSTHAITIYAPPNADFTASPLSGTVPLTVTFTDQSTGEIISWSWDFGDGGTSTDQHPTHTYTDSGTYTVSLAISGPGGTDALTRTSYITVYEPVGADFTASPLSGAVPLTVTFTDQSSGEINSWSWDFGDRGTSAEQNPIHTYTISGTYTVTLTVSGSEGSDTETKANYIHVTTAAALAVTKQADPNPVQAGEALTYTIRVTNTGNVTLTATVTDVLPAAITSGETPSGTLILPSGAITWTPISIIPGGVWSYTFVVTVEIGYAGPLTNVVRVTTVEGATGVYTEVTSVGYLVPRAAFTASSLSGTAPLTVTFTDQSTGDIISWDWTFGDGNVGGARHPGHEYSNSGVYTVTLTVYGPGGSDTKIKTDYLAISPPVSPTWTFLLYLDGDNNLDYWFERALDRLEVASANFHVAILVQFDGSGNGDTWRYKIQPGVDYSWYMGELDMGDPQTLSDFVIWARDYYTTEHTYLAVADHGRGTTGIAWDDTSGSDHFITVAELRTALQGATADGAEPLDVVHYDACLMAMIEDAYQVKDYADYLVAAENLGWSVFAYDLYAAQVATDTTPEILATAVVSEYHNALAGYPRTISALDLGQAITVTNAISTLATSLQSVLSTSIYHVQNARTAAQKFDSRDYYVINNNDEYLDLYDLARLLQQYVDDADVDLAAQQVMDAVTAFVVAERHESGYYRHYPYWNLDDAHGVSIYFPKDPGGWEYDDYIGDISFRFTIDGKWDEFLQDYYGVLGLPPVPTDPGQPPMLELPHEIYLPIVLRQ